MILHEYERLITEQTMTIRPYPENAPKMGIDSFIKPLEKLIKSGKAFHNIRDDSVTIILHDIVITEEFITILIKYADKNATDPSFTDTNTGSTRTEPKKDGEGISVSAHLVVSRAAQRENLPTVHDIVLEDVPGLTRSIICGALKNAIRLCTSMEFESPKTKKQIHCRPIIEIENNANETLEKLLEKGSITGFVAIKSTSDEKMDEDGEIKVIDHKITLGIVKSKRQKAKDLIQKSIDLAKDQKYSRLQIKYENDETKRRQSLDIHTGSKDIFEKVFARSSKVNLTNKVEQCQTSIHSELSGKMIKTLETIRAKIK